MDHNKDIQINRRRILAMGIAGAGALGLGRGDAAAANKKHSAVLALTAPTTEGPYYFDAGLMRADITEGLQGVPLEIRLSVIDQGGAPLKDARVDVWHCNAAGVYSGYAGQGDDHSVDMEGKTFLRGSQMTDAQGIAAFRSIYPGWYEGRTTHIHLKLMNAGGSRTMLATQFFLPDALNEFLYTRLPDYQRSSVRETLNSNDGIALMAGSSVVGAVREDQGRYVATLSIVVDKAANAIADRPPAPGEGPPGIRGKLEGPEGLEGVGRHAGMPPPGMGGPQQHGFANEAARIAALIPGRARD